MMPRADPTEPAARPLQPGTITRLAAQKKHPDRVSVFLDGAFAFGVAQDLVLEYGLARGRHLSVALQKQLIEADQVLRAKALALGYLAGRARTEHEVRQKLQRHAYGPEVADRVVERLHALGYLDDAAYAQAYVRARFRNRGYGPKRLRSDLMRRGVARSHIDAALDEQLDQDDLDAAARAHAEKRWARLAGEPDPRKRKKKLADYLLRRGFSYDTVRRMVDALAKGDA
jgi:regulatory protein